MTILGAVVGLLTKLLAFMEQIGPDLEKFMGAVSAFLIFVGARRVAQRIVKTNGGKAVLIAAASLVLFPLAVQAEEIAKAGKINIRTYGPAYVATHYSDADGHTSDAGPWIRARGGLIGDLWDHPATIRSVAITPQARFTYQANQWPTGAPSSPITESHYMPGIGFEIAPAAGATWGRIGPVNLERITVWPVDHLSNGTDVGSASIDKTTVETKWTYEPFGGLLITGYARGWYITNVGAETLGMLELIDWDFLKARFGGDFLVKASVDWFDLAANFGLTSQDVELYLPFANPWRASLYVWLHNGEIDSIVNYGEETTSGGAGVAFFHQ